MHLADGIAPLSLALAGYAGAGALVALSLARLRRLPDPQAGIPRAAMMTSVFFAASLVAIPVPPASVHLMLVGLSGVLLGWFAVPALLVGLFLQAVLFGHGGLTALGLNLIVFALPALMAAAVWRLAGRCLPVVAALAAGGGAVVLALGLFWGIVALSLPAETGLWALPALMLAHLPLVLAEAVIVAAVLRVLARVEPGLLAPGAGRV